jgi:hypothetical protein
MGLHNGPASLGRPHRRAMAQLPDPHGQPCPYCGEPMLPGEKLDADHEVPRVFGGRGLLRWAHSSCNRSAGAELGNRLRGRRRDVLPERWIDRWA